MTLSVINDTHGGVVRAGGTTPKSAWALRLFVLERFKSLLQGINTDLLVLGDLLDQYMVPYLDLLEVMSALVKWLSDNPNCTLFLAPGNHDLSKTTTTLSSFQFLCNILVANSNRVVVLDKAGPVKGHDAYVIPHVANQELFNIELGKVPKCETLYVHCNYNNKFAQESDHSLNLSEEQAKAVPARWIVFAHEHQQKVALAGKVVVIGNQIPTSVADCLGNDTKSYIQVSSEGIKRKVVWEAKDSFVRVDWREALAVPPGYGQFVRVEGEATAAETSGVVAAVSKLRSMHNAFVVTNSVKIEGRDGSSESKSLEQIKGFSITNALERYLSKEQWAVVSALMEEHNVQRA